MSTNPEVLVVGGGPGGSSAAHWLARSGREVLLVEKKEYPREKTCGDGLTPRSIHQLIDMGFDFDVPEFHRIRGLRAYSGELMMELDWPDHPIYPNWGGVIRRADLDMQVAQLAEKQGVTVRQHTSAAPIHDAGMITGVELTTDGEKEIVHPKIVVVADGSLSRFGRALGTVRDKKRPFGLAARAYFGSPMSEDGYLESQLDLRDEEGHSVPGYGWVFPLGDGVINVGVGALSTFHRWKELNTNDLMSAMVRGAPDHWDISEDTRVSPNRGGKLPMSLSVGPKVGPNWVLIGDAAGAVNPFNGEGIDYAYETGRMAAAHIDAALAGDDLTMLGRYEDELDATYELYFRVSRAFVRLIGKPHAMRVLTRTGLRSKPLMEWTLRVMANLMRPEEEKGMGERVYDALERIVKIGPNP
jgi:geranylgeranyl reductase family protein